MKYATDHLLESLYHQTEQHLTLAITVWQQLPSEFLNAQPAAQQWSAAQCLDHLNHYGDYYLPAIGKAIQAAGNTVPASTFRSSWLGNYFYTSMQTNPNGYPKKRMKAPANSRPAQILNAAQVLQTFITQQEQLQQLLREAKNIDISKARVPISIAPFIKLKCGDTFLFYVAHIHRHILQAQRALLAAGCPAVEPALSSTGLKLQSLAG